MPRYLFNFYFFVQLKRTPLATPVAKLQAQKDQAFIYLAHIRTRVPGPRHCHDYTARRNLFVSRAFGKVSGSLRS